MCVLFGDTQNLPYVLAIGVRKFPAGLRSFAINLAGICLLLEERTRGRLQDPIAVCVALQVATRKVSNLHPEVLGDANDIALFEDGTRGFAAIGAGEAIDAGESSFVSVVKLRIEVLRGFAPPPCEQALDGLAVARRPEQLPFVFVLQCGSWNAGLVVKDVSVNVCRKAVNCSFCTELS